MQQVNLYLPEFQPSKEPLQAVHMLAVLGTVLLLMVLISLGSGWKNSRLQTELADTRIQLQQIKQQVQVLRDKQPKSKQTQLEREIAHVENEIQRRERILTLIDDQNLGNAAGFSAQMQGMARQHLSTLSIDYFGLNDGGSYVEFSGWTRKADQVPLFIQRLRQEESFQKVGFGVLTIERSKERADAMQFSVTSPEEDTSS